MKLQSLFVILLAMLLTGCVLQPAVPEDSVPLTTQASPVLPTETQQSIVDMRMQPSDEAFVKVIDYIPDLQIDLRYATDNNFTKQRIYVFEELWLRYGTVKKLQSVQQTLKQQGLCLKIWDGFRPPSAQYALWEICPDPTYVSDPTKGFSSHSRGNTVDVTLTYADGTELVMPTGFDDFSKLADRDYSDCTSEAASNAQLLETIMQDCGFKPYSGEWWHFTDTQTYSVEETFEPISAAVYYANCNEYISLRERPSPGADAILKIAAGEQFAVFAWHGSFALVEYKGVTGYVLCSYIQPVED